MSNAIPTIPNLTKLEQQFEYVNSLIERHRSSAIAKVNMEALLTNWEVGQYISQHLKSAQWGAKVVSELADYLKRMNPRKKAIAKETCTIWWVSMKRTAQNLSSVLLTPYIWISWCNYQLHNLLLTVRMK